MAFSMASTFCPEGPARDPVFIQAGGVRYHHDVRTCRIAGENTGVSLKEIHVRSGGQLDDQLHQDRFSSSVSPSRSKYGGVPEHPPPFSVQLYSVEDIPGFIAEGCFIHGIWRRLLRGGLFRPCFILRRGLAKRKRAGYPARVHEPRSGPFSDAPLTVVFSTPRDSRGAQYVQRECEKTCGGRVRRGSDLFPDGCSSPFERYVPVCQVKLAETSLWRPLVEKRIR